MGVPVRLISRGYTRTRGLPLLLQMHFIVLLLFLMAETPKSFIDPRIRNGFDYSTIDCRGATHTMVLFPEEGPGRNCHGYVPDNLSQPEKDAILHKHNEYRNALALGQYPLFPKAEDMKEMSWDEELEKIAQRWADQCNGLQSDDCNDVQRFSVGQNLAVQVGDFQNTVTLVDRWFNEINSFSDIPPDPVQSANTFTQLAWGSTYRVGCGRARYIYKNENTQIFVCNYGPGGNLLGEPLYSPHFPCSYSTRYPGLCEANS